MSKSKLTTNEYQSREHNDMLFKNTHVIPWDVLDKINENFFIRQSVYKLIDNLPIEYIKKLFNIEMIDTRTEINSAKLLSASTPPHIVEKLNRLDTQEIVEINASIVIKL